MGMRQIRYDLKEHVIYLTVRIMRITFCVLKGVKAYELFPNIFSHKQGFL